MYLDRVTLTLNGRDSKKVGNNTYLKRRGEDIALMYHTTDILTWKANGDIVYITGGWKTHTTKERFNSWGPLHVFQVRGVWYYGHWKERNVYADGMIYRNGTVILPEGAETGRHLLAVGKQINEYVKGYVAKFRDGTLNIPDAGDCFYCHMVDVKTGKPMPGTDHLTSHFEEKYYVPSLLVNAVEECGDGTLAPITRAVLSSWHQREDMKQHAGWMDIAGKQIASCLKKYLRVQFGLPR